MDARWRVRGPGSRREPLALHPSGRRVGPCRARRPDQGFAEHVSAVLDGLPAEVCVEVRYLDGEDVEHGGERTGVAGVGDADADADGLIGVVAEPGGGATDE